MRVPCRSGDCDARRLESQSTRRASHRDTVTWLRPYRRAMSRSDRPLRRNRTYCRTSFSVTRRYDGSTRFRSREVGWRGRPRSRRGLRPSIAVRAVQSSRWISTGALPLRSSRGETRKSLVICDLKCHETPASTLESSHRNIGEPVAACPNVPDVQVLSGCAQVDPAATRPRHRIGAASRPAAVRPAPVGWLPPLTRHCRTQLTGQSGAGHTRFNGRSGAGRTVVWLT